MRLKLIHTLLSVLFTCLILAQDNDRFTSYTVNDGLSQSSIDDIIQDKDGFLWIGTAGGLCRFDGYNFKTYKKNHADPNAISSDRGFHFYLDKAHQLWVISFNGISLYDPVKDNFTNLLIYEPKDVITIENHIYGEDEKFIWIGLCNYGLVRVNRQTHEILNMNLPGTRQRRSLRSHFKGFLEKGRLWIANGNELDDKAFFIYDTYTRKTDTVNIPLTNIISLNDSQAVGINTKEAVLINKKKLSYELIDVTGDGSEPNVINLYRISDTEALICSTTKGLFFLNTTLKKITKHISTADPASNKNYLNAKCAYKDHSGNWWIGTPDQGLQKLAHNYKKFRHYISYNSRSNNVMSIYADSAYVYAGCPGKGFDVLSKKNGFIKNVAIDTWNNQFVNSAFIGTAFGKDKLLMIGFSTRHNKNNMPFTYSPSTGRLKLLDAGARQLFAGNWGQGNLREFIFQYTPDSFLTNIGENLAWLKACNTTKTCSGILHRFPGETLSCCFLAADNTLWIGTYKGAYYRQNGAWKKQALPESVEIKTISQDSEGYIWMGTASEIYVIDRNNKVIKQYNERNSLANGHVYGILRDNDGNMWFSHNKGLSVYRWKEKTFQHYGKDDGLQSAEFNASAYFKAPDGELFFGGINGITSFYPGEILNNPNNPHVKITGIKLFEEPIKTDTSAWNKHALVLPYTDNSLSFEFVLPEFSDPKKNQYAFTMTGIDNQWINSGDKHFARYPALRPGHYLFKVKASNNDGIFGNEITTIDITIIPPFWQRFWFIGLCVALAILAAFSIGIFIQKLRQKKQIRTLELQHKIQMERERISRDLHDNVGTQLSLISKNIEGVIHPLQSISETERINNLSAISQTSKEVIFTLRDTIWALNKEEISFEEFSDKLKGFTQKILGPAKGPDSHFTEQSGDGNIMLSPSEAIHLFRICQEAISNALKYANAGSIKVDLAIQKGKYQITITDDGIGFEHQLIDTTSHYGIENMKFRAQEITCNFTICTLPGQGTKIEIRKI